MAVDKLSIKDFRNITCMQMQFSSGFNVITGANGAGKTTILEAIYVIARGRSFRSSDVRHQIRKDHKAYELIVSTEQKQTIGMRRSAKEVTVRLNATPVTRLSQVAECLPVFAITPKSHELIEGTPDVRRRFLDWGMFHVEHHYGPLVQRYNKILKQRNASLRQNDGMAHLWDEQLATAAIDIAQQRESFVQLLDQHFKKVVGHLTDLIDFGLLYHHGWGGEISSFREILTQKTASDMERGFTSVGPHRGDFAIQFHHRSARDSVSRGQQKILAVALLVAQIELLAEKASIAPVLLIDDIPSELDRYHLSRLLDYLSSLRAQMILTSIEPIRYAFDGRLKMFHVEHGTLIE